MPRGRGRGRARGGGAAATPAAAAPAAAGVELAVTMKWTAAGIPCRARLPFTLSRAGADGAYAVSRVLAPDETRFGEGDVVCSNGAEDDFGDDRFADRLVAQGAASADIAFKQVRRFRTDDQGLAFPVVLETPEGYRMVNRTEPGNFAHYFGLGPDDLIVSVNNLRIGSAHMSLHNGLEPWLRACQPPIQLCILCKARPRPAAAVSPTRQRKRNHETAYATGTPAAPAAAPASAASALASSAGMAGGNPAGPRYKRHAHDVAEHELEDLADMGLFLAEQKISLSCPVTLQRLRRPARGAQCTHAAAVEADYCVRGQKCPLCSKVVNAIVVDHEFQQVLANAPPACTRALVTHDGYKYTFRAIEPPATAASTVLDLDGDDTAKAAAAAPESSRDNFIDRLIKSMLGVPPQNPGASFLDGIAQMAATKGAPSGAQENQHANPQPAAGIHPVKNEKMGVSDHATNVLKKEGENPVEVQTLSSVMAGVNHESVSPTEKLAMVMTALSVQETAVVSLSIEGAKLVPHARWPPCRLVLSKSKKRLFIGGVEVLFPHRKPLVPQTRVMVEMISCFKNKNHALLESPTGTGKTAATLSAALAWQRYHDMREWADFAGTPRVIYYLTRTHSQATQVVAALRDMPYRPMIVTLASRTNLCANQTVIAEAEGSHEGLSTACAQAVKAQTCSQYKNLFNEGHVHGLYRLARSKIGAQEDDGLFDIEDLRKFGHDSDSQGCPFYSSKALYSSAQLVICPYNYVIDPEIRSVVIPRAAEGSAIFIFDEGHNLESACLETGSCTLQLQNVLTIVRDLCVLSSFHNWITEDHVSMRSLSQDVMNVFDKIALFLLKQRTGWIRTSKEGRVPPEERQRELYKRGGLVKTTGAPLAALLFSDLQLSKEEIATASDALNQILRALADLGHVDDDDPSNYDARPRQLRSLTMTAAKALRVLTMMMELPQDYYAVVNADRTDPTDDLTHNYQRDFAEPTNRPARQCCRLHGTYLNEQQAAPIPDWTVELRLMLMNPGAVFDDVATMAHSVIVASGTLFPMNSLEFGKNFHERLRVKDRQIALDHVIKLKEQLYISVIPRSPGGDLLDGSYRTRQTLGPFRYEAALFETIRVVLRDAVTVRGGSIVFVSSYKQLGDLESFMQRNGFFLSLQTERGPVIFENGSTDDDGYGHGYGSDSSEDGFGSGDGGGDDDDGMSDHGGRSKGGYWGTPGRGRRGRRGGFGQRKKKNSSKTSAFELAKARFRKAADQGQSPVLFAVFRGRMSEGIDFKNDYCRAVFLVGIPYPALFDSAIKYKRAWSDEKHAADSSYVSGSEWYSQQAFRAMNQALGRVIRHKYDFGAVFLVDARLEDVAMHRHLARWCRRAIHRDSFPVLVPRVREFFARVPEPLKNSESGLLAENTLLSSSQQSQDSFVSLGSD